MLVSGCWFLDAGCCNERSASSLQHQGSSIRGRKKTLQQAVDNACHSATVTDSELLNSIIYAEYQVC